MNLCEYGSTRQAKGYPPCHPALSSDVMDRDRATARSLLFLRAGRFWSNAAGNTSSSSGSGARGSSSRALAQSSLGTGAAYVALLLSRTSASSRRGRSASCCSRTWLPAMVLGPVFGAAADRWSRRTCMVVADLIRAVAFVGIFLVDGFVPTVAAGAPGGRRDRALHPRRARRPPEPRGRERLPAATVALRGGHRLRLHAGPAVAARCCSLFGGTGDDPVRSTASASSCRRPCSRRCGSGRCPQAERTGERPPSLLREAREGLRGHRRDARPALVLVASAAALFFAGDVQRGRAAAREGGARRRRDRLLACSSRSTGSASSPDR